MNYYIEEIQTSEGVQKTAGVKARDDADCIFKECEIWQRFQKQHWKMKHSVMLHANRIIILHQRIKTSMEKNFGKIKQR